MATLSRRDVMKLSAAGVMGASMSGWLDLLALRAAAPDANTAKPKSCILLWMEGGPTHKDTFDMRPGTENGGPLKEIATNVPGIRISENFPKLATRMNHAAIIRSMSTGEGSHGRARYFLHTGYREGPLDYPSIGSICSAEIGDPSNPLPNYVAIGGRMANYHGSGFLGPRHQPLQVASAARGVANMKPIVANEQFNKRVGLLEELEDGFHRTHPSKPGSAHRTTYQRAVGLMMDRGAKAFDIADDAAARKRYGGSSFGDGCLMARKLVESGVRFVEVGLGGWDMHNKIYERITPLSTQVDNAISGLIDDLKASGRLDDTLIVWMGEFGRTPKINSRPPKPGRDHYPRAWSTVLVGGGIKGGQVIGKTDKEAAKVVERPVNTIDYMATICRILGINYEKFNQTPIGRPIRIVDRGANPISELF